MGGGGCWIIRDGIPNPYLNSFDDSRLGKSLMVYASFKQQTSDFDNGVIILV